MTARSTARVPTLFVVGLFLTVAAGCGEQPDKSANVNTEAAAELPAEQGALPEQNRGTFGTESCESSERVAVDGNAVVAVYFDADGQEIGSNAESLMGTTNKMMCPAPTVDDPSACAPGYCPVVVLGKTRCRLC